MKCFLPVIALTLSSMTIANAAAPKQLYNKTVTINWGESGVYKRLSDGVDVSPTGQFQHIVYISSAGRPFVRGTHTAGKFGGARDSGPEQLSNNVQFGGNSIALVGGSLGMARHIVATFDGSFSNCSTSVTIGKIGPAAKITGFDGAVYEIISMQPGATSCSIRDGNALAN